MSKKFKITIEYAEWLKEEDMWNVIDMHVFYAEGTDKKEAFRNAFHEIDAYAEKNGYAGKNIDKTWSAKEVTND